MPEIKEVPLSSYYQDSTVCFRPHNHLKEDGYACGITEYNYPAMLHDQTGNSMLTSGRRRGIAQNIYERIILTVRSANPDVVEIDKDEFLARFEKGGILKDDPRLRLMLQKMGQTQNHKLDQAQFMNCIQDSIGIVEKALSEKFVVPDFQEFTTQVKEVYHLCQEINEGEIDTHIPSLAKEEKDTFAAAICTIDG